jgi:hypothetical protein
VEPSSQLLDESTWVDGAPPERVLVTHFAAATPEVLALMLRRMIGAAIEQIAGSSADDLARIRAVVAGELALEELQEDEWNFPGGSNLLEALGALASSRRLWRAALKSLGHAVAAAEAAVGAVIEHRDYLRDPRAWKNHQDALERLDPAGWLSALSPERKRLRAADRQEAWHLLLSRALMPT